MAKPHRKYKCILNPPGNFADHEDAIRRRSGAERVAGGVRFVGIRYGYGPCAELTLDVATGEDGDRALVAYLEDLRIGEDTRLIAIDEVIDLEAA